MEFVKQFSWRQWMVHSPFVGCNARGQSDGCEWLHVRFHRLLKRERVANHAVCRRGNAEQQHNPLLRTAGWQRHNGIRPYLRPGNPRCDCGQRPVRDGHTHTWSLFNGGECNRRLHLQLGTQAVRTAVPEQDRHLR